MLIELRATAMDITQRLEKEQAQTARREAEVAARSRREFLDNSGEGFLSFGRDLIIDKEYSRECRNIFNMELAGQPIARVLYSQDPCGEKVATKNFNRILSEEDPYTRQLYLSLMPEEYSLGEKYVRAVYKCIAPGRMMLILTDITQQKQMETEVYNEHHRLKFVVSAVIEIRDFFELLEEFDAFQNQSLPGGAIPAEGPDDFSEEIYRHIHTFKGLFSQQNFIHMPQALHRAEDYLSDLIHTHDVTRQHLKNLLEKFGCSQALAKDLEIIRNILGQSFLAQKGQVSINRETVRALAKKAGQLLKQPYRKDFGDAVKNLLTSVIALEYIDLKTLIFPHAHGAEALASRLGKQLKPIEIQGEDTKVLPDLFSPFTKTLVHVFRNAVDHGIESMDERAASQKDEAATIFCIVQKEKDSIHICIGDDGRGIDLLALKTKAVSQGLLSETQASCLDPDSTLDLLFQDRFSMKRKATEFSGRGMGLSAVRNALARLNGEAKIETMPAKGTTFHFWIPLAIVQKEMNSSVLT
jgi:two-component system chemotaxis sensor kinase CheA